MPRGLREPPLILPPYFTEKYESLRRPVKNFQVRIGDTLAQTWKTTAIRRIAVRETSASRQSWVPNWRQPLKPFGLSQHFRTEGVPHPPSTCREAPVSPWQLMWISPVRTLSWKEPRVLLSFATSSFLDFKFFFLFEARLKISFAAGRKIYMLAKCLPNWMKYDYTDSFPFDYEPNSQKKNCQYDQIPFN